MISLLVSTLLSLGHAQVEVFGPFQKILDIALVENPSPEIFETHFDYQKLAASPLADDLLAKQVKALARFDLSSLKSKEEANSFYINAYNFLMIQTIMAKGIQDKKLKVNSVKDFGSFFNPYKVFKDKSHRVGGRSLSLDDIEKGILLGEEFKKKGWKDSRIHFAVNCASVGCPPLRKQVYTASQLDKMLDENVQRSLKTPRHLKLNGQVLHVTHLFKWYEKDFKESHESVLNFIRTYSSEGFKKKVTDQLEIRYIEYDWLLNHPGNFK